jgi:DNA repair photolyase
VLLRLPHGLGALFEEWLTQHYPNRREKVLNRLREMRGGTIYDSRFGSRMTGQGTLAEQIGALFALGCRQAGLNVRFPHLSTAAFRRPGGMQKMLFE